MGFRFKKIDPNNTEPVTDPAQPDFDADLVKLLEAEAIRLFSKQNERKAFLQADFVNKIRNIKDYFTDASAEASAKNIEETIKEEGEKSAFSQIPVDVATLLDLL